MSSCLTSSVQFLCSTHSIYHAYSNRLRILNGCVPSPTPTGQTDLGMNLGCHNSDDMKYGISRWSSSLVWYIVVLSSGLQWMPGIICCLAGHITITVPCLYTVYAFSALMLFVGHPTCKNWVVRYWCGYLSRARCKLFAYGPADATATPSSLAAVKFRMVYLLVLDYPGFPGKRSLNGCSTLCLKSNNIPP